MGRIFYYSNTRINSGVSFSQILYFCIWLILTSSIRCAFFLISRRQQKAQNNRNKISKRNLNGVWLFLSIFITSSGGINNQNNILRFKYIWTLLVWCWYLPSKFSVLDLSHLWKNIHCLLTDNVQSFLLSLIYYIV